MGVYKVVSWRLLYERMAVFFFRVDRGCGCDDCVEFRYICIHFLIVQLVRGLDAPEVCVVTPEQLLSLGI